jgi:quercetin dioxygenase-like cupin family protein
LTCGIDDELVCTDFNAELQRLRAKGARLDIIYPADDPHTAILTEGGRTVRLTSRPDAPSPPSELPPFEPEFVLTPASDRAAEGRAGMFYRDLIPSRLGGRYVASHITIPTGGTISDWVHFHRVAMQLIVVRKGWVRLVYEDHGDPFIMNPGDLVLQPPTIRHQVLESSPGLEVVEVTCPALHETFADHDMKLPNGRIDVERDFEGQRFLRHIAADASWVPFQGGEAQETGLLRATRGVADGRIIRGSMMRWSPAGTELIFGFVLEGSAQLDYGGGYPLGPADAFVIPPDCRWGFSRASNDFRLLNVTTVR